MKRVSSARAAMVMLSMLAVAGAADARTISVRSGSMVAGQHVGTSAGSFSEQARPGAALSSGSHPAPPVAALSPAAMPFPGDPMAMGPENIFAVAWSGDAPRSFDDLLLRMKHRLAMARRDATSAAGLGVTAGASQSDVGLMMLVGIGLIGYQLRRKQKALQPHPFAA
jgi:hypothetical protein